LKSDGWSFIDLTAVDRLHLAAGTEPVDRFEIVMQLLHLEKKDRLMVRAGIAGDPPTIASITKVWPAANAFEREVYDLFGVRFEGHPDLTRIMLPDEWEGHPLRKDYGVGKVTVQYLPQPVLQVTGDQGTSTVDSHEPVDRLGQAGPPRRGAK
jgi:NADH-quinone oxidoreductase subunit C